MNKILFYKENNNIVIEDISDISQDFENVRVSETKGNIKVFNTEQYKKDFYEIPEGKEFDIVGGEIVIVDKPNTTLIAEAKEKKTTELMEYDSSTDVNEFSINGIKLWLSKNERNSIYRGVSAEKSKGDTTTTLQITEDVEATLPIDQVLDALDEVEVYSKACYNVTANHKKNIKDITTTSTDVNNYNFKTNYPTKPNITIQ